MIGFNRIDMGVDYEWAARRRRFQFFVRFYAFIVALLIVFLAHELSAQTKVLYYSSKATAGQALPQECETAGSSLLAQLNRYPKADKAWTFLVACDDKAWTDMMYTARNERGALIFAATNPYNNTTLVRGTALRGEADKRITPEIVVEWAVDRMAEAPRSKKPASLSIR